MAVIIFWSFIASADCVHVPDEAQALTHEDEHKNGGDVVGIHRLGRAGDRLAKHSSSPRSNQDHCPRHGPETSMKVLEVRTAALGDRYWRCES